MNEIALQFHSLEEQKFNSMNFFIAIRLGHLLSACKRYEAALSCYDSALSIDKKNAHAIYNKGRIFDIMNKKEEALKYYTLTLELQPDYGAAMIAKIGVLEALQNYEQVKINPSL